jgi:hypothetical protein
MARIVKVKVLQGFNLHITFDDGFVRVLDLEPMLFGAMFAPLRNRSRFQKVRVNKRFGCIEWPNGADLCPDALYRGHVSKPAHNVNPHIEELVRRYNGASKAQKKPLIKRLASAIRAGRESRNLATV